MFLSNVTQSQLDQKVATFVSNGQLPQAQAVLGPAGYTSEVLREGQALLEAWRENRTETRASLRARKEAVKAGRQARQMAQQRYGHFCRAIHTLFGEDEALIRLLGLRPHGRPGSHPNGHAPVEAKAADSNGHGNGATPARSVSTRTADVIDRYRASYANALRLDDAILTALDQRGWSRERIAESAELVEDLAQQIIKQREATQAHHNQSRATKALEEQLRHWYRDSRLLGRSALQQAGLEGSEVQTLLGL